MPAVLLSHRLERERGADLVRRANEAGASLRVIALPEDPEARLPSGACPQVDLAFFSEDVFPAYSRQFFSAVRKAPNLKWLHVFNAGVDHPIYTEMLARGVRLTTSSGSTAEPIAQTAIAGLLMLARNFPRWLAAQREHAWNPARAPHFPPDLRGQTMVLIGLGSIGADIARLARVLGLHVIGVRRGRAQGGEPVDELHTPDNLKALLPRAQWLVVACPLTPETRGLVDAAVLAQLPKGARLINIARGEIVDEPALVAALSSGHLAGAYLDVFQQEPLPAESALWDLPNVIITPHNSAAASGNETRVYEIFADNLRRWYRDEPLVNEVKSEKRETA